VRLLDRSRRVPLGVPQAQAGSRPGPGRAASALPAPGDLQLAIFSGADELVPVADSARLFSAAACHPDRHARATLTVQVFPGADHRVQTNGGTRLASRYLDTLTRWILDRRQG
jgi:hypothetical protein